MEKWRIDAAMQYSNLGVIYERSKSLTHHGRILWNFKVVAVNNIGSAIQNE